MQLEMTVVTTAKRRLWPTVLGLAIALAGPPLVAAWSKSVARADASLPTSILLQAIYGTLPIIVLLLVRYGERLPWHSVGFRRPTTSTVVSAVLVVIFTFLVLPMLTDPLVKRWAQPDAEQGVASLAVFPMWFRIVLAVTGGPIEELLYRGYAIERLTTLTSRRWLGATLAVLAFAAAHIPTWGFAFSLIADLPAGIVLTLFYLWRRDLVANMLAHALGLTLAMFLIVPAPA